MPPEVSVRERTNKVLVPTPPTLSPAVRVPGVRRSGPVSARPLFDYVLVRRAAAEDRVGALFIPERAQSLSMEAEVVAIAAAGELVQVGERVLVPKHGGTEVHINGEDLIMLHEDDIHAVLE